MPKFTSITRAVLEHLAESGGLIISAFFPNSGAWNGFLPNTYPKRSVSTRNVSPRKEINKRSLSSILWRLRQEGLVTNSGPNKGKRWRITPKGRMYLKTRPPQQKFPKISITLPSDGILRLVSFDIPEKERPKRKWLRRELIGCGYQPLHKSVFVGTRPLPQDLIKQIDLLRIGHNVHIASIEKSGTIIRHQLLV